MTKRNLIYPIFLPMQGCPHRCIYCDQEKISASGTLDINSEIANAARFVNNHPHETKEIAFYGGSFTALTSAYRTNLMNRFQQIIDDTTSFRISTHPLYINEAILAECAEQGITCIELGIQDFCSDVLQKSQRGYSGEQALQAAKLVQQHGFKLGVQLLPGLPGSSTSSIAENINRLSELKPDYLRIYPLILIKGTALTTSYNRGEYLPLSLDEAVQICADYAETADREGITVIKLGLPSTLALHDVVAGPYHPAFGEFVLAERLIRKIICAVKNGEQINLDKKQRTLILAHKGRFKLILQKRLENCSVKEQSLAPLL
ncbi:MAG: radical SAM protein [Candidatus Cloacimonas sp.]|jgi:histone acetyltransferase (RNA polymerase elongator complex component)|nr:radical SAM protein [Candidatus Cloacimonas sp.]